MCSEAAVQIRFDAGNINLFSTLSNNNPAAFILKIHFVREDAGNSIHTITLNVTKIKGVKIYGSSVHNLFNDLLQRSVQTVDIRPF